MTSGPQEEDGVGMGESHDFMSLDWVHSDIEDTLVKAQNSLEAYLLDTSVTEELQACGRGGSSGTWLPADGGLGGRVAAY